MSGGTLLEQATAFLLRYHEECGALDRLQDRLDVVRSEIERSGTYVHTEDELRYGAQVAWRNSNRCIGRLYWRSLHLFDKRDVTDAKDVHRHCVEHLEWATNGGSIRPTVTVFAPEAPHAPAPRILNEQLVRYAGYRQPDGSIVGDPRQVRITDHAGSLGWRGDDRSLFDPLPLIIRNPDGVTEVYDLPPECILEVPIVHPEVPGIAELGLRWYAVPAIANMRLELGGVSYPAAPFNGWYMGTEIGARNLADPYRYDLLPAVAAVLGLETHSNRSLWKDRAIIELNYAVLHSYQEAGVKMTDHHTEARNFLVHIEREAACGREVPADWTWIVPPISGAVTPVFHRLYRDFDTSPNFYHPNHDPLYDRS